MKFGTEDFYKNLSRNAKFGQTRPKISGTVHEVISTSILFSTKYGRRVRINREKHLLTSCPSACLTACLSTHLKAAATGRIFVKFGIASFYGNLSRNSKFG
jgi:hypothetical protein